MRAGRAGSWSLGVEPEDWTPGPGWQMTSLCAHIPLLCLQQDITNHWPPFPVEVIFHLRFFSAQGPRQPYQSIRVDIWNGMWLSSCFWTLRNHQSVFRPDFHVVRFAF